MKRLEDLVKEQGLDGIAAKAEREYGFEFAAKNVNIKDVEMFAAAVLMSVVKAGKKGIIRTMLRVLKHYARLCKRGAQNKGAVIVKKELGED